MDTIKTHEESLDRTTIQVRKSTQALLRNYRKAHRLRPAMIDLASVAIEEYIRQHPVEPDDAA